MKIVYRAKDLIESNLITGLLESEGIRAVTGGDYLQGGMGEIPASGLNTVLVDDEDYQRAKQIVQAYEEGHYQLSEDVGPDDSSSVSESDTQAIQTRTIIAIICVFFILVFALGGLL